MSSQDQNTVECPFIKMEFTAYLKEGCGLGSEQYLNIPLNAF